MHWHLCSWSICDAELDDGTNVEIHRHLDNVDAVDRHNYDVIDDGIPVGGIEDGVDSSSEFRYKPTNYL